MGEKSTMDTWRRMMSPEIVEIGEESKSAIIGSRDEEANDVFVAVGKNDLDVVKWVIDHAVSPGARVYLVHVYPTITYFDTPVGRLSRSQLSKEQVKTFVTEENNRRRNLLQRYIRLCTDAKVAVDTVLLESNDTAKAILDLIPVLNITNLVMGTKQKPSFRYVGSIVHIGFALPLSKAYFLGVKIFCNTLCTTHPLLQVIQRLTCLDEIIMMSALMIVSHRINCGIEEKIWSPILACLYNDFDLFSRTCTMFLSTRKGQVIGEIIQNNAPDFCEVTTVYEGKKVADNQHRQAKGNVASAPAPNQPTSEIEMNGKNERKFSKCIWFSGRLNRS